MARSTIIGLALVAGTLLACRDAARVTPDAAVPPPVPVVARVGTIELDADDMAREIAEARGHLAGIALSHDDQAQLIREVRDRFAFDVAVRERARREGVAVGPDQLEAALRASAAVHQYASPAQHRRAVETGLLLDKLVATTVDAPTPGRIRARTDELENGIRSEIRWIEEQR